MKRPKSLPWLEKNLWTGNPGVYIRDFLEKEDDEALLRLYELVFDHKALYEIREEEFKFIYYLTKKFKTFLEMPNKGYLEPSIKERLEKWSKELEAELNFNEKTKVESRKKS